MLNRKQAEMAKVTGAQPAAKPLARGQAQGPGMSMGAAPAAEGAANPTMQMAAMGVKAGIGK